MHEHEWREYQGVVRCKACSWVKLPNGEEMSEEDYSNSMFHHTRFKWEEWKQFGGWR